MNCAKNDLIINARTWCRNLYRDLGIRGSAGIRAVKLRAVVLAPAIFALAAGVPVSADARDAASANINQNQAGAGSGAQTPSQAVPTLQEVIVTATLRKEPLMKLPEAITAITGAQLQELNAQTFEDYFRTVPGLMLNSTGGGANRFDFSIRGVSDFSILTPVANSTVGQYLDEIPVTAVGQQIDPRLVDIDRIEVLRGPQGTYFGEDSIGGTIRIITQRPNLRDYSGAVDGRISWTKNGAANDSESAMLNLPLITDRLAFRANYYNADDSGFIDGVGGACTAASCSIAGVTSKRINPDRGNGARAELLFQPTDNISLLGEYIHQDTVSQDTAIYEPKVGDLKIIAVNPDGSPGDVAQNAVSDQSNLYNFTADLHFSAVELVSSSSWGYHSVEQDSPMSVPSGVILSTIVNQYNDFAQEVRLLSAPGWSERWDYILGWYYNHDDMPRMQTGPGPGGIVHVVADSLDKETAGFGELGYKFTDRLSGRVGVRYESVDFTYHAHGLGTPLNLAGRNTPTTGRAVLSYNVAENALVYGSVSKGFQKGGLQNVINPYTGTPTPGVSQTYQPSTATNYELGTKLRFPSYRAAVTAAIYHINWNDIQVPTFAYLPGAPAAFGQTEYYSNAGTAKVDGLELEGHMLVAQGFQVQATVDLMNPRITANQPLLQDNPAVGFNAPPYCQRGCPARAGDEIPFVSKVTASLGLNYRHPLGSGGFSGFVSLSEQYTGPRNTTFAPTWTGPSQADAPCQSSGPGPGGPGPGGPGGPGPGGPGGPPGPASCPRTRAGDSDPLFREMAAQILTNVQFGIENGHWRVALYADNVFDRRNPYIETPSQPGLNTNGDEVLVDRPRTMGLWLRYAF